MKRSLILAGGLSILGVGAWLGLAAGAVDEEWKLPAETVRLAPGPGADFATANCLICHSADYLTTQPPLTREQWLAIVTKMRQKFGAPVPAEQADEIVDYLARNYGRAQ